MENNQNNKKPSSELRFDLVSKDWVVIATGRARKPETFKNNGRAKEEGLEKDCPFCHIETQAPPVYIYPDDKEKWEVVVFPNKYPAFSEGNQLHERAVGPYQVMDGLGFHEVVVTRDHRQNMAQFSAQKVKLVIDAYQERYLEMMNEKHINYVSIFHNNGKEAGASMVHPHSQIIAMPVIDPDLRRSLDGSRIFFENHGSCVHCAMLEWELEEKIRIIFENDKFVVVSPFAAKVAFETRIYPKEHKAYFERIKEDEKEKLAEALQVALNKICKGLVDPAYNFFIHTSPCDGKNYDHYHWHFEILPKTSVWAGFELGTGIQISTIEPEKAAEYLRRIE
ncbi:MAG: galactose-1-phosphate uridylyltransferase [Candidatus Portnoybacteria bacterium RBG_19FT_COMBO_36_7]|uniref:Galactose-1-phosphate uridylyltransferase n=1 Tax=Candidatus Portnoybacteria bacterium RBG_19FT_COMBO_36_7 TaxID=1801992 RepID=A0A1G2F7X9_9BACT|nr:MAG: galactose-1-phosphate uridylyltransferase [Candidatus Portnoybacteria bacterium RBG_19FT_COMBO_36_7]